MRQKKDNAVQVLAKRQLAQLKKQINNLRDLCLIFIGFECGCRVGEMGHFTVAGFNPRAQTLMKFDIKKKEWREVGISPWLVGQLQLYINTTKLKGLLFPISGKQCDNRLKFWCSEIGVEDWVSWHLLRRTYTSQAVDAGVPPKDIQHVTGDQMSTIQKYYNKVSPGDMGGRVAKIYEEE